MTDEKGKVDHEAEAARDSLNRLGEYVGDNTMVAALVGEAQVHATLALVEQVRRVANTLDRAYPLPEPECSICRQRHPSDDRHPRE